MANSMASISGNKVQVAGYGNIATNSLTLSSLNSSANDATLALMNGQNNGGAINVSLADANVDVISMGQLTNSTVNVGGNALSTTAVANFATSRITRN
jgi:hypothetical protein